MMSSTIPFRTRWSASLVSDQAGEGLAAIGRSPRTSITTTFQLALQERRSLACLLAGAGTFRSLR